MTQKLVTQEAELSSQLQLFLALFGCCSFSSHATNFFSCNNSILRKLLIIKKKCHHFFVHNFSYIHPPTHTLMLL